MTDKKPRHLITFKEALARGHFKSTTAYKLINAGKIDAYRMEGRTMIDADSIDRYHESLPKIEPRGAGSGDLSCCRFSGRLVKLIPPCVRTQQG